MGERSILNRKSTEEIQHIYRIVDDAVAKKLQQAERKPSCRIGCAACCRYPFACSVTEMIFALTEAERNMTIDDDAIERSYRALKPSMTRFEWTSPCPLLTPQQTCGAYRMRPVVCRGHVVFNGPSVCERKEAVMALALGDLNDMGIAFAMAAGIPLGLPVLSHAPAPISAWVALRYIRDGRDHAVEQAKRLGMQCGSFIEQWDCL